MRTPPLGLSAALLTPLVSSTVLMSWSWCDDHGNWSEYAPPVSRALEAAFADPTCAQLALHLVPHIAVASHSVDFSQMVQVNNRSGFGRPMRREAPPPGATPFASVWYWQDDQQRAWRPYDPQASGQIAAAHAAGRPGVTLHTPKWTYWIDFRRGVQVNTSTSTERPVRCDPSAAVVVPGMPPQQGNAGPAAAAMGVPVGVRLHILPLPHRSATIQHGCQRQCLEHPKDIQQHPQQQQGDIPGGIPVLGFL